MENRFKIWVVFVALVAWAIGAVPAFGQTGIIQALEDGSTIFPVFGNNLVLLDSFGRLEGVLNSRGGLTTFSYDSAGNLSQRTAADTKLTQYGYDALNRMVAVTNDGVEVATFDHDNNGNTLLASDSDTSVSFGYNAINQLTASTQTVNGVTTEVGYGFDLNGNRSNIVYPYGLTVNYTVGSDNRLESVTFDGSMLTSEKTISFGYDTANRLDGISYPNGVNSTFGHDAEGRITSIQHGSFIDRITKGVSPVI